MSGGVAFADGDHDLTDTGIHVEGPISSFVAEGAAMLVLLQMVPTDQPLTVLTDSANVMWALQHCSRLELFKDFSKHFNQRLVKDLQREVEKRTAEMRCVKITAHTSIELNERADYRAAVARLDKDAPTRTCTLWTDPYLLHFYRMGEEGDPVPAKPEELREHFLKLRAERVVRNQTRTIQKMLASGVGRNLMYPVLWGRGEYSVADKVAKRMLQCLTNTFPTTARLHRMGIARHAKCPFCTGHKSETLFHWQQECTRFHDARTKVHDDIWKAVFTALRSGLPPDTESYRETPIGEVWLHSLNQHKQLKPDGIFLAPQPVHWTIVDFTRGAGNNLAELRKVEERKRAVYSELISSLQHLNSSVEFFPLATTYNGAIAVDTWRACMNRLGLDDKAQTKVLYTAAHALCIGFSTMVDIRLSCRTHAHTTT